MIRDFSKPYPENKNFMLLLYQKRYLMNLIRIGLCNPCHFSGTNYNLWILRPPLISNTIPVEKSQSPRAMDATAFPISSGIPQRF